MASHILTFMASRIAVISKNYISCGYLLFLFLLSNPYHFLFNSTKGLTLTPKTLSRPFVYIFLIQTLSNNVPLRSQLSISAVCQELRVLLPKTPICLNVIYGFFLYIYMALIFFIYCFFRTFQHLWVGFDVIDGFFFVCLSHGCVVVVFYFLSFLISCLTFCCLPS